MSRPPRQGRIGHGSIMYRPHLKEIQVERQWDLRWALIVMCLGSCAAAVIWALW